MPSLILIRGLPGSGKSTLARSNFSDHILVEADMFMVNEQGFYEFDPTKLPYCHHMCKSVTKESLETGYNVVVANTFTRLWEMEEYLKLLPYVLVIRATGNFQNVHGVPGEAIQRMRERFEPYDRELIWNL